MAKGKKYDRSLLTYLRLTDLLTAKSVLTYLRTLATCLGAPTMFITRMLAACSLAMVAWVGTPTAETKSLAPLSMTTWLGVGVGSAQGHGRACHRGSSARVGHFATTGVMLE